jgi:peroxiredoxin
VQKAHENLKDKDVVFLAISIDGGGENVVKPFVSKQGYTFPVLIDARMEVARAFGARALPTTYVIDRRGNVVAGGFGPVEFESPAFMQYIEALAAQSRS